MSIIIEYREYLLQELGERNIGKSDQKSEENETANIDKKDIFAKMLKNNDESTEYFKISKSQIKNSFRLSAASCFAGLVFFGFEIYSATTQEHVSVSVISLISGSISEFVSGTVFWIHNKSALQLNHYYDKLHENEKFLSAISIADNLSTKRKEEILIEIVHKQINGGTTEIKAEIAKEKGKNN